MINIFQSHLPLPPHVSHLLILTSTDLLKTDLDEMASEAHLSEEKAQKAMIDAARLADELRAEQEHAQVGGVEEYAWLRRWEKNRSMSRYSR